MYKTLLSTMASYNKTRATIMSAKMHEDHGSRSKCWFRSSGVHGNSHDYQD